MDLAAKYGKMYALEIAGGQTVFLNDVKVIKEAFITKGDIISDRIQKSPSDPLFSMIGFGKGFGSANYGKQFKQRKTLTLQSMKDFGFGGKTLEDTVSEETTFLTNHFEKVANTGKPTDIHQRLIHLAVSNVICSVVFGKRFSYDNERFAAAVDGIRFLFTERSPFLEKILETIPWLRFLPIVQKIEKEFLRHGRNVVEFIDGQIQSHIEEFDVDCPKDFIDLALQIAELNSEQQSKIGPDNVKKIIWDLFFAGTDTTAASLIWFLLYMIRYPAVQQKCQREIDNVMDSQGEYWNVAMNKYFPYTTAALLEVQRISSIAGASLPHVAREDTTVGGYNVSKGSVLVANLRFLHMDEQYWKNPKEFRPERWLDPTDPTKVIQHANFVPFSIGKRRCLGENLAKAEYSVFAITLLRNFTFKMEDPANPPKLEGFGLIYSPFPFKALIETRTRSCSG